MDGPCIFIYAGVFLLIQYLLIFILGKVLVIFVKKVKLWKEKIL